MCGTNIAGANLNVNVNTNMWGAALTHIKIVDDVNVINGVVQQIENKIGR